MSDNKVLTIFKIKPEDLVDILVLLNNVISEITPSEIFLTPHDIKISFNDKLNADSADDENLLAFKKAIALIESRGYFFLTN